MPTPRLRVAHPPPGKPLVLFDGPCRFCRLWVERWSDQWPDRVDYRPGQSEQARFPEIPPTAFSEALHLVETDGIVSRGAEAALRTRALARGRRGVGLWAYYNLPGARLLLETVYGLIARFRGPLYRLVQVTHGPDLLPRGFGLPAAIFLQFLAAIYLVAFASFWWQVRGLLGPDGILPAQAYLDAVAGQLGDRRWSTLPTLCWIFGAGSFLHVLGFGGVVLATLALFRRCQGACFALLWVFYLSVCAAGQVFFNYQWDALLLETGLLAVFLAPWNGRTPARSEPPRIARWLLVWLLFRLMFMSGLVKLTSGDTTWRDLTALLFHYQTQPLPTVVGWWAHQLPAWFQKFSCAVMFGIELVLPFFVFGPRRLRVLAALGMIALQLLIALTGNYTFFNLLTIALCLLLLDNAWWSRWLGVVPAPRRPTETNRHLSRWVLGPAGLLLAAASVFVTSLSFVPFNQWSQWQSDLIGPIAATRSVNSYGLFRVMTKSRPELVIEGSRDGRNWEAYEFKWKPGDPRRRPGFVAPHQPRLDWQLWFAALAYPQRQQWVVRLCEQILQGNPAALGLLGRNPFPDQPPVHLRVMIHEYRMTTPADRARTGNWWRRDPVDYYFRPVSLRR